MKSDPAAPAAQLTAPAQLTPRAIILSVVLAVILAAANAYLGLFAGLTIATAIPAAVVSMGVLRLLGGGTILENNIVQTGASAGSSIAACTRSRSGFETRSAWLMTCDTVVRETPARSATSEMVLMVQRYAVVNGFANRFLR